VLALKAEGAVGEEAAQHRDVLDQAVDPHLRRVHRDPRGAVVVHLVAGAEADLEPPLGEHVDRGHLAGEDGGVAEVGGEDGGGDAQLGGRRRRGRHRGDRAVALVEVVGGEEGRVAERLQLAGRLGPAHPGERRHHLDAEPEGMEGAAHRRER
jgi:hypothetical protein